MKIRVIPTVLTDGLAQVKGAGFDNWRTIGSVMQAVRVQSARDVDELLLLDVMASWQGRLINLGLIEELSEFLRIPLTVGGGIKRASEVADLLRAGADKVVVGTSCVESPSLIGEIAGRFGSQVLVCAVDVIDEGRAVAVRSGTKKVPVSPVAAAQDFVNQGAGEILLQDVGLDGTMSGMNLVMIKEVSRLASTPVIASSGLSSAEDALLAAVSGASAVASGAALQFTELTPNRIKNRLSSGGFDVRSPQLSK